MRLSGFRATSILFAVVVATSASGYWGYWAYSELRTWQLRNEVLALVYDASLRIQTSLASGAVNDLTALNGLYDHVEAIDAHFRKLRHMEVGAVPDLAYAADNYLTTTREILLRRASSARHRMELSARIEALRSHMRADDRTGAWISKAVLAKERVEDCYRDYNRAINALATLLGTLPASGEEMSSFMDAALLADDAFISAAREEALVASRQAADEMEIVRQLSAYR